MKTKNYFLGLLAFLLVSFCNAQTIKNGSFENWATITYDDPNNWLTLNAQSGGGGLGFTVTKVQGKNGSAVKIETIIVGKDTLLGYLSHSTGDPFEGEGGIPFSQKADSLTGYYKCDIKPNDTSILVVTFKKNGVKLSTDVYKFSGIQNSFTRFAFKISSTATPDSVIVAIVSSNAISNKGIKNGSYVILDELNFSGTTQAMPNEKFDNWTTKNIDKALNWVEVGLEGFSKTTDKYKGNFAMLLETVSFYGFTVAGRITNGYIVNGRTQGGSAYQQTKDTLVFYYKYIPVGNDTGNVSVSIFKNQISLNSFDKNLLPTNNYTKVEIPLSVNTIPDTLQISFSSSLNQGNPSNIGTKFFIDEVQLKSSKLNTGIANTTKNKWGAKLYPNPTTEDVYLDFEANQNTMATYTITDILGKTVIEKPFEVIAGRNVVLASAQQLPVGVYFYNIVLPHGEIIATQKFSKQ